MILVISEQKIGIKGIDPSEIVNAKSFFRALLAIRRLMLKNELFDAVYIDEEAPYVDNIRNCGTENEVAHFIHACSSRGVLPQEVIVMVNNGSKKEFLDGPLDLGGSTIQVVYKDSLKC